MTEVEIERLPKRSPDAFGGKAPSPLAWYPLPHMQEWLDEMMAGGEISDTYIRAAKVGLTHFAMYARSEGIRHPNEIERPHILRFQAYLTNARKENGDPLTLSYRQQLMKYVRNWINWLQKVEYLDHNPWVRIRVGRVAKKPKPLEDDEIALLFDAHRKQAFSIAPFYYHRRETILVLLYGWGLRISELQALTVSGMDMRLDWVTVRNKSRQGSAHREKVLPYGAQLKTVVNRWLAQRSKSAVPGEDSLLIDQQGRPLSAHMIRKIVTELGNRAGITINPHRLRDTFGTTMLDNDVEIERIMKLMGHTQRSQTLAYARVNDRKLRESHDRVMEPLIGKLLGGELP